MDVDVSKLPVSIRTVSHLTPSIQLFYPRLTDMSDLQVQESINHVIYRQVQQLMHRQSAVQVKGRTEMQGMYELKTNQRGVISLLQSNYAYTAPMAHGMTFANSLTFSVHSGKPYLLGELFKPNSNYLNLISDSIRAQIKTRNIPLLNEFKGIRPDQYYYIADKALVIYFRLYDITPYYAGFPMFPISVYELQDTILENSPLGKMLADI